MLFLAIKTQTHNLQKEDLEFLTFSVLEKMLLVSFELRHHGFPLRLGLQIYLGLSPIKVNYWRNLHVWPTIIFFPSIFLQKCLLTISFVYYLLASIHWISEWVKCFRWVFLTKIKYLLSCFDIYWHCLIWKMSVDYNFIYFPIHLLVSFQRVCLSLTLVIFKCCLLVT